MKKFVFAAIAVLAVTVVTLSLNAQPAGGMGGDMGGFGGGAGGGMMGGGMGGMRGARGPVVRPDKAARLAAIKTLETQIAALKAAIEKAPEKDTAVTAESDQATIDKATAERQAETDALAAVQATLASLRNAAAATAAAGARGGRGGMGGATADVLSELRVLANDEKATKTVAKLDALIKEAQTTGGRGARQGRGQGGGMMGGGAGGMMGGGAGGAGGGRGGRGGAGGV